MVYSVFSKPVPLTQPNVIAYDCEVLESSGMCGDASPPWECADVSVQVNEHGECDLSTRIKKCTDITEMKEEVIAHCKRRAAFVFGSITKNQDS